MEVQEIPTIEEIQQRIAELKSSNQTYVHRISDSWKLLLSEGCFLIREMANAYWIFDLILSYQSSTKLICTNQQEWNIKRIKSGHAQIICRDKNKKVLVTKLLKVNKFPLQEVTILIDGIQAKLKSEF